MGRTAKTSRSAALQTLQPLTVWVLALNLENRVFYSKTEQRVIELNVDCTVHMKNKSDFEHPHLTRGPDSGPHIRILSDLVFSFPLPSPLFCPRTAKTRSGDEIIDGARS